MNSLVKARVRRSIVLLQKLEERTGMKMAMECREYKEIMSKEQASKAMQLRALQALKECLDELNPKTEDEVHEISLLREDLQHIIVGVR